MDQVPAAHEQQGTAWTLQQMEPGAAAEESAFILD